MRLISTLQRVIYLCQLAEASDASKQLLQTLVRVMWLQPVPETHFISSFV